MSKSQNKVIVHSYNNHLQIGYDGQSKSKPGWNFKLGTCQRATMEWRAELELAAHQISTLAKKEVYLYVDGSLSSQVMVQAFKWAKVPFLCVTPRFKKDLNIHSLSQAILFFETHDMPYEICEVDSDALFLSNDALQLSKKFASDRPTQILAMKVWQTYALMNKFIVFPFGLPRIEKDKQGWKVIEYERDFGVYQFQQDQQIAGVSCFFKWSPELVYSFMHDPVVRAVVTNLRPTNQLSDEYYKEIFQNYFQTLGAHNWNGFEKLSFTVKKFHQKLNSDGTAELMALAYYYTDYCARIEFKKVSAPSPATNFPWFKVEDLPPVKKGNLFYNQVPKSNPKGEIKSNKTTRAAAKKGTG